jgi:hypothetical protein
MKKINYPLAFVGSKFTKLHVNDTNDFIDNITISEVIEVTTFNSANDFTTIVGFKSVFPADVVLVYHLYSSKWTRWYGDLCLKLIMQMVGYRLQF